jgi:hypothetical protein
MISAPFHCGAVLSLVTGFLQGSIQLNFVFRFTVLTKSGKNGKIAVDLLNLRLTVVRLFDTQGLAFLPIDRQRFKQTDFPTTHNCL